jgi:polar amino acid transport system ATP-binding protein
MPGSSRSPASSSATATTVLATTGGRLHELRHRQVTRQRARIGMVFQQFNLFGHMTALENIIEGPVAAGVQRKQAVATASELLDRVGLAGREGSYPRQMSGGQQQRVAIARALATSAATADAVRRADERA